MTSEEILASIKAHFVATYVLTPPQLAEHKRRGACPACERPGVAQEHALATTGATR